MDSLPRPILRAQRAVSLLQPWASLFFRVKKHETRSRAFLRSADGETVVVHASAKFAPLSMISEELHKLCMDEFGCSYAYSLPLGRGLGTVRFGATLPTWPSCAVDDADRICGDWTPHRFATRVTDACEWAEPIPQKGALSLWRWPHTLPLEASHV